MGACLSCLGLGQESSETERSRLLYSDDPYNQNANGYGTYGGHGPNGISPQNILSPEEVKREQEALNEITKRASDHVVEIFPHQHRAFAAASSSKVNGSSTTENGSTSTLRHDILLSMIPGDKSQKSVRLYPASRPTSGASLRSKSSSTRMNGSTRNKDSSVFVKLNVDWT